MDGTLPCFQIAHVLSCFGTNRNKYFVQMECHLPHHMISNLGYRYKGTRSDRWALVNRS